VLLPASFDKEETLIMKGSSNYSVISKSDFDTSRDC